MERYSVRCTDSVSGKIVQVWDGERGEALSTYSVKAWGRDARIKARDEAESLNASDARVAWNTANDDLLPYMESREYQRDMED